MPDAPASLPPEFDPALVALSDADLAWRLSEACTRRDGEAANRVRLEQARRAVKGEGTPLVHYRPRERPPESF